MANATKKAVLRALIEGSLYEILVKSNIENVVYSVDGSGNEVYLSTKLAEIITDLGTKATTTSVTDAINALREEMLGDTPVEAYNTFTELAQYISEHKDAADALTAAVGNKADKSTVEGIQTVINGLGALATKSIVSENDLDSALKEKVNAAAEGNHSHANKELLDTYDQTNEDIKDAVQKKHEHTNKAELDKIVSGDKAKWDKAVTDLSAEITRAQAAEAANAAAASAAQGTANEIKADYLKQADKTEIQGNINTVSGKVDTLIGSDANKSVRTIANEELAAQLIADGAKTSLDTLEEIAAWIQSHPDDAAAMNEAIVALQNKVNTGNKTVTAYVTDAIAALNIGNYAKAADLTALAARVSTLEGKSHEHSNKTVLDGISDENVAAWNAAEGNAKGYADGLNGAMDTRVKAVEAAKHSHGNKMVLDGITAQQVAAWTGKSRIIYSATQPADLGENDLWVQLL